MYRHLATALLVLAFGSLTVHAEDAVSPNLTEDERTELLTMLDASQNRVMDLISGLSDAQWTFKSGEDRWSVAECTEHIVRSQRALLGLAQLALSKEPDPEWLERTRTKGALIRQVMPNRQPFGQGGATAPMEIRPTENWDRAKAIQEFYTVQGEVVAYVEALAENAPIKQYTAEHPFPVFGWLNAYDWLIYVPLHTERHSRQIEEVQADPNYPKE